MARAHGRIGRLDEAANSGWRTCLAAYGVGPRWVCVGGCSFRVGAEAIVVRSLAVLKNRGGRIWRSTRPIPNARIEFHARGIAAPGRLAITTSGLGRRRFGTGAICWSSM